MRGSLKRKGKNLRTNGISGIGIAIRLRGGDLVFNRSVIVKLHPKVPECVCVCVWATPELC